MPIITNCLDWDASEEVPQSNYWEEEWKDNQEVLNKIKEEIEQQKAQAQKP